MKLRPEFIGPLGKFLVELEQAGDEQDFHPHPLTEDAVRRIESTVERDQYYVVVENGSVIAYGMLRGWDEGYEIPSLGIAVSPKVRGQGLGRVFIRFLHIAAKRSGASKVRLTVNRDNVAALRLYESLGYAFEPMGDRLVGRVSL